MTIAIPTEIYNKAFDIFFDPNRSEGAKYNDMQSYLREQIRKGIITVKQKAEIVTTLLEEM